MARLCGGSTQHSHKLVIKMKKRIERRNYKRRSRDEVNEEEEENKKRNILHVHGCYQCVSSLCLVFTFSWLTKTITRINTCTGQYVKIVSIAAAQIFELKKAVFSLFFMFKTATVLRILGNENRNYVIFQKTAVTQLQSIWILAFFFSFFSLSLPRTRTRSFALFKRCVENSMPFLPFVKDPPTKRLQNEGMMYYAESLPLLCVFSSVMDVWVTT